MSQPIIALFTDFGANTPYPGLIRLVLAQKAPNSIVIDFCHDLPAFTPRAAAYLLPAYTSVLPRESVVLSVVDPGVGSKNSRPSIVRADSLWFVGPDNGIFNEVARKANKLEWWDITWKPINISNTFHGRDLFAPVAAQVALGKLPPGNRVEPKSRINTDWPKNLAEIIYIDRYGNGITGIKAESLNSDSQLIISGQQLIHAHTFSDVKVGEAMWYANSNNLIEICVNQGSAAERMGLTIGTVIEIQP